MWVIFLSVVILISVQPFYTPSGQNHLDKLLHFIGYAGISVLPPIFFKVKRKVYYSEFIILITAFLTEGVQYFMPTRTASIGDIAANITGIAAGILAGVIIKKLISARFFR